jgi:hypothetical protein
MHLGSSSLYLVAVLFKIIKALLWIRVNFILDPANFQLGSLNDVMNFVSSYIR